MEFKTIISEEQPLPLTAAKIDDLVVLQLHRTTIRLGKTAARWLLEALEQTQLGYSKPQYLNHQGGIVLTVLNESHYIYIIGMRTKFNMKSESAQRLIDWLGKYA